MAGFQRLDRFDESRIVSWKVSDWRGWGEQPGPQAADEGAYPLRFGLALETCIPADGLGDGAMEFDFGAVDRGYGWIFPKGDHLNVGLYSLNSTIPQANRKLAEFVAAKTGQNISGAIHGHRIPHDGRRFRQIRSDACLIGDAAGMIDPFLGEGIYNAVRSGQLAAGAILKADSSGNAEFSGASREITLDLASYDSETRRFYADIRRGYRRLAGARRWRICW